jgi:hypothetical protein
MRIVAVVLGMAYAADGGAPGLSCALANEHKSGTVLVRSLIAAQRTQPAGQRPFEGSGCERLVQCDNWSGFPRECVADRIVLIARDPFDLVLSGYNYHRTQPALNTMTRFPELEFLWSEARDPPAGLPRGRANESYAEYLRRVPLLAGLRTQATRALSRDLI